MKIYDVSIPISPAMHVYPGDPNVSVEHVLQMSQGDVANVTQPAAADMIAALNPDIRVVLRMFDEQIANKLRDACPGRAASGDFSEQQQDGAEGLASGNTTAAQLGKWEPEYAAGMDRMRRLVCEFYDGFSFGRFIKKHPHLKGFVTDVLIGDLFKPDVDVLWPLMDEMRSETSAQYAET